MTDTTQDFENMEKALALLRAYRRDLKRSGAQDLADLGLALLRYVAPNADPETTAAQFGELLRGQVILANTLIEVVASSSNQNTDDILEDYEDHALEMVARRGPASRARWLEDPCRGLWPGSETLDDFSPMRRMQLPQR